MEPLTSLYFPEIPLNLTEKTQLRLIQNIKLKGKKVLELGCGTALYSNLAIHFGASLAVSLDLSAEGLRLAKRLSESLGHDVTLIRGDAENLPFRDESFDGVMSFWLLEHLPNLQATLKESFRILSRGGCLLFSTMNKHFKYTADWLESKLFPSRWKQKLSDIGHSENRYFYPEDVKKQLENVGFKRVRTRLAGFFLQTLYDNYIHTLITAGIALVMRRWRTSQGHRPLKTESPNSASWPGRLLKTGIKLYNNLTLPFVQILTLPDKILERQGYSACFYVLAEK